MDGEIAGLNKLIEANKHLAAESKVSEQHHHKQIHKLQITIQQTKSELSDAIHQIQSASFKLFTQTQGLLINTCAGKKL